MTILVLHEALRALELLRTLAAHFSTVNRRLVIVQVALLRISVGTFFYRALVATYQMPLEVVSQQDELFGAVVAERASENDWQLLVRRPVVLFKGLPVIKNVLVGRGRAVDA